MMADEATNPVATESAPVVASSGGGIKTAAEVIAKVTAPDPAPATTPAKDAKGKFVTAEKAAEPARRVEKLEAKAAEKPAVPVAPEPDAEASALAKARFHLQHGNVAKAIEAAFGELDGAAMANDVREALARKLGVGSKQWEEIRKFEQSARRKVAAREQELGAVVERLKAEYAPLHQARRAYEAGDYDAAFKAAFGEDAADYQRKIISQRVGKNPEIEKLRAELETERAERTNRERAAEQTRLEAEEAAAVAGYIQDLGGQLAASEDPAVRKYAARPAFVQRVFAIQRANYNAQTNTTIPVHIAAEAARDEILKSLQQWQVDDEPTGALPANAARASAPPVKPPVAKAPARALTQSRAAEANGKPNKETSAQVRERHQRLMETTG